MGLRIDQNDSSVNIPWPEKGMKDADGKPIVDLPPKEITVERLAFSHAERKLYDMLYKNAKATFNALHERNLVGKNYSTILAKLMLFAFLPL